MIPLCKPVIDDLEANNVLEVLKSGILASGEWVKRFEENFRKYIGTEYAVANSNGTVALDIALKALGLSEGDEVIVPDFTFIATANAVLFQGAKPVFSDIDEETFNLDPDDVAAKITSKTKAIIGVHLFGHPFDLGAVKEICEDHGLFLLEDCAQAHGAEYKGQRAGSFGDLGCFSFYATKNMTTGEGGMVTTSNERLKRRLDLIVNHGQSQKYLHTSLGYNYRLTNIQAAIGIAQLEKLDGFNDRRIKNAERLNSNLSVPGLKTPFRDAAVKHVYHQYAVLVEDGFPLSRDEFLDYLGQNGVGSAVHYPYPVHMQPLYKSLGYASQQCPIAMECSKKILSLPVYPGLRDDDMNYITNTINKLGA
jgi:perosamine synthetase